MVKKEFIEISEAVKKFFKERSFKINQIIVFGSYAKGNYTEESDLDLAIISEDFEGKDIFQKTRMVQGLNWLLVSRFMLPFDLVFLSPKEWQDSSSLVVEFAKEGIVFS